MIFNNKKATKRRNPFVSLRISLLLNIFEFAHVKEICKYFSGVNKQFLKAVNSTNLIKFIKANLENLLSEIEFTEDRINLVIEQFGEFNLYENDLIYIVSVLLNKKNSSKITSLDLYGKSIGKRSGRDIVCLKRFLIANNTIESLSLAGNNKISNHPKIVSYLAKLISKSASRLKYLNLSFDYLGAKLDLNQFFFALAINETLEELHLSGNNIGNIENNFSNCCRAIKKNKKLTVLFLDNNQIGKRENDINYLTEALTLNKTLIKINLKSNFLETYESSVCCFIGVVKENKTLKEINLSFNEYNEDSMNLIREAALAAASGTNIIFEEY